MKDLPKSCFNCRHLSSIKEGNKEYCCVTGYEIEMDEALDCDDFEREMKYPFDGPIDVQPAGRGCMLYSFALVGLIFVGLLIYVFTR